MIADMQPLLNKYGVDLFVAGHWHYYESLWPGTKGTADCPNCLQVRRCLPVQWPWHRAM